MRPPRYQNMSSERATAIEAQHEHDQPDAGDPEAAVGGGRQALAAGDPPHGDQGADEQLGRADVGAEVQPVDVGVAERPDHPRRQRRRDARPRGRSPGRSRQRRAQREARRAQTSGNTR